MARLFDRNMFIMLFAIMIGVVIITFFIADLTNSSKITTLETEHAGEIKTINTQNENFISNFIRSTVELDKSREYRAEGNHNFSFALFWYQSALVEDNITKFNLAKTDGIENCINAMPLYMKSYDNFVLANGFFNNTKSNTTNSKYLEILDLYVNLTDSGSRLALLQYNATVLIKLLTENLIIDEQTGEIAYLENMTEILEELEDLLEEIDDLEEEYKYVQTIIDDYEFFDEIRGPQ